MNTVTTNVPGPPRTLVLAGRRMLETFPYVPIAGHVRIGIAIYSYDGALSFGVTADDDAAPDVRPLTTGIERGIRDLLTAARAKRGRRARRKARPKREGTSGSAAQQAREDRPV